MNASSGKRVLIWGGRHEFIEGGAVLGRKVANAFFLSAPLAANPYDTFHLFVSDSAGRPALESWLREHDPAPARRCQNSESSRDA